MTPQPQVKKFKLIKYSEGYYIQEKEIRSKTYFINDKIPKDTFDDYWKQIDEFPEKIEILGPEKHINHRYVIYDKSLVNEKLKESFKMSKIIFDDDGNPTGEFGKIRSLYKLEWDVEPPKKEKIEFECNIIFEIGSAAIQSESFAYPVKTDYGYKDIKVLTNKSLNRRLIDEISIPSIYLNTKPCKLTSKQTYDIIREYIKTNINPKYACITSDYDFCFTVRKRIQKQGLTKFTTEINKRKSILNNKTNERLVEVFEMTHSEENYKGYSVIDGVEGKNENDLKERMDNYLKELMEYINTPLKDCPNCNGTGVLPEKLEIKGP